MNIPFHFQVSLSLITGLILGIALEPYQAQSAVSMLTSLAFIIGQLFLRIMFLAVLPMVFCALSLSVCKISQEKKLSEVGSKTFLGGLTLALIAACLALVIVNAFPANSSIQESLPSSTFNFSLPEVPNLTWTAQSIVDLFPKNPLEAATNAFNKKMGLLSFLIVTLLFGISLARCEERRSESLKRGLDSILALSEQLVLLGLSLAPLAVGCLVFHSVSQFGTALIFILARYVCLVLLGLTLHQFVTYGSAIFFFSPFSPKEFFTQIRPVMLTAFSTSSSNATLPVSIQTAKKLGLNQATSHFVLSIGATMNQNGSGLYEGITAIFLSQVYGVELPLLKQLLIMFSAMAASIGTAGVPGGTLPFLMLILPSIGVPEESIALILGVERLLDMSRTVVNVTGDLVLASCLEPKRQLEESPALS